MCPTNTFTAVIAAAGLSARMGAFKPILPLGEESISRSLVLAFVGAGSLPVTVVTGYMAETLASHLGGLPVRLVHNSAYRTSTDWLKLVKKSLYKKYYRYYYKNFHCRIFFFPLLSQSANNNNC